MHPDTLEKPKCLLDIAGRPVLGRIADWLNRYEINNAVINLHWKANLVLDYLDSLPSLQVICSVEKTLLGTAGGIRACLNLLDEVFVVVYGDVLTNLSLDRLMRFHESQGSDLTMASYTVTNPQECGVIISNPNGQVTRLVEKPTEYISDVVNSGVIVCRKAVFDLVPPDEPWDIARDLIPNLLRAGRRIFHLPLLEEEWLIDMGTRVNYRKCCDKYKRDSDEDAGQSELLRRG